MSRPQYFLQNQSLEDIEYLFYSVIYIFSSPPIELDGWFTRLTVRFYLIHLPKDLLGSASLI